MKRKTSNPNIRSNRRTPQEWAKEFDELVASERLAIFAIGRALIAAQEELSKKDFASAIKLSGLRTRTTAMNYMRVADSKVLSDQQVQPNLPTGVGALIDLAAWEEDEIKAAIENKVLHPQSQRKALQKWVDQHRRRWIVDFSEEKPAAAFQEDAVIAGYIMTSATELTSDDQQQFARIIFELNKQMPNFNFYITTDKTDNSITFRRTFALSQRILAAYRESPELFIDPQFERLLKAEDGLRERFFSSYVRDFAKIIANADHKELHKKIKLTKVEWEFLGVERVGEPTITPFLTERPPDT
jgi:hypothetical protein